MKLLLTVLAFASLAGAQDVPAINTAIQVEGCKEQKVLPKNGGGTWMSEF